MTSKPTGHSWKILAPVADFATVEAAGLGEELIDWNSPGAAQHEACTLSFAALEIAGALNKVPGESAALQPWRGEIPSQPFVLILTTSAVTAGGRDAAGAWCKGMELPRPEQAFIIRTCRQGETTGYLIVGADRIGALYGAYEWLNRMGFRWFSPDPWDAETPTLLPNDLPALETCASPSFESRGFMGTSGRAHRDFLLWMARNRMNKCGAEKGQEAFCRKCGIRWLGGGHDAFGRYLPAKTYFEAHPEWYGLRNGQRSPKVHEGMGDNICLSNPAARAEVARNAAAGLVDGPERALDILQLWPFDHYDSWCECENCAALGNKMDHMLRLAHDVRQAIRRAMDEKRLRRNVQVSICAYHNTLVPPTRPLPPDFDHENIIVQFFVIERCYAHAFDDPHCTEANAKLRDLWRGWTAPDCQFRGRLLIGEYYNVSTFAGMAVPFLRIMERDIPFYRASGARDIDYMHVLARHWGTHALTNSQFAAMIWNCSLDVPTWLDDFFKRRYGALAGTMERFYRQLETAMRNCKPLKHYMGVATDEPPEKTWPLPDYRLASLNRTMTQEGSPDKPVKLFQSQHLNDYGATRDRTENDGPSILETVNALHEAAGILDQAILDCREPRVSERLASDARRFRYTRLLVLFIHHLVRLRMLENRGDEALARAEAQALRQTGEALRAETVVCRNFQNEAFENGLTATFHSKTFAAIMRRYFPDEAPAMPDSGTGKDIVPA